MLRTTLDLHNGLSKVSWVAHEGWQHGKSVWFVGWQTKEVACGQLRGSYEAIGYLWNVLSRVGGSI